MVDPMLANMGVSELGSEIREAVEKYCLKRLEEAEELGELEYTVADLSTMAWSFVSGYQEVQKHNQ